MNAYPKIVKFDKIYVCLIFKLYLPYRIFSIIDITCDSCMCIVDLLLHVKFTLLTIKFLMENNFDF